VASLRAFWFGLGAAIQKVLRVGFLTHQVMVGFGMRVGANNAEYVLGFANLICEMGAK
jgi:hypothetical protein